jgi:hypothetical protein
MIDSQSQSTHWRRGYRPTPGSLAKVMIGCGVLLVLLAEHGEESVPIVLGTILILRATLAYWHVGRDTYRGVVDLLWVMLAAVP